MRENGLKFEVNLSDYVDTGLFLDHRDTRARVRDAVKGKRFLNLFAYTGAFSVYAAADGAASTVSVDLSPQYCDWTKRNLKLNALRGEVICADCSAGSSPIGGPSISSCSTRRRSRRTSAASSSIPASKGGAS
ncbi:MAG: class I SAM-dependent methyltransferase [Myxococcaceae bacterium]|nr:class I SAM-dependent methyltransferase [Myxococcaceae bacterium]